MPSEVATVDDARSSTQRRTWQAHDGYYDQETRVLYVALEPPVSKTAGEWGLADIEPTLLYTCDEEEHTIVRTTVTSAPHAMLTNTPYTYGPYNAPNNNSTWYSSNSGTQFEDAPEYTVHDSQGESTDTKGKGAAEEPAGGESSDVWDLPGAGDNERTNSDRDSSNNNNNNNNTDEGDAVEGDFVVVDSAQGIPQESYPDEYSGGDAAEFSHTPENHYYAYQTSGGDGGGASGENYAHSPHRTTYAGYPPRPPFVFFRGPGLPPRRHRSPHRRRPHHSHSHSHRHNDGDDEHRRHSRPHGHRHSRRGPPHPMYPPPPQWFGLPPLGRGRGRGRGVPVYDGPSDTYVSAPGGLRESGGGGGGGDGGEYAPHYDYYDGHVLDDGYQSAPYVYESTGGGGGGEGDEPSNTNTNNADEGGSGTVGSETDTNTNSGEPVGSGPSDTDTNNTNTNNNGDSTVEYVEYADDSNGAYYGRNDSATYNTYGSGFSTGTYFEPAHPRVSLGGGPGPAWWLRPRHNPSASYTTTTGTHDNYGYATIDRSHEGYYTVFESNDKFYGGGGGGGGGGGEVVEEVTSSNTDVPGDTDITEPPRNNTNNDDGTNNHNDDNDDDVTDVEYVDDYPTGPGYPVFSYYSGPPNQRSGGGEPPQYTHAPPRGSWLGPPIAVRYYVTGRELPPQREYEDVTQPPQPSTPSFRPPPNVRVYHTAPPPQTTTTTTRNPPLRPVTVYETVTPVQDFSIYEWETTEYDVTTREETQHDEYETPWKTVDVGMPPYVPTQPSPPTTANYTGPPPTWPGRGYGPPPIRQPQSNTTTLRGPPLMHYPPVSTLPPPPTFFTPPQRVPVEIPFEDAIVPSQPTYSHDTATPNYPTFSTQPPMQSWLGPPIAVRYYVLPPKPFRFLSHPPLRNFTTDEPQQPTRSQTLVPYTPHQPSGSVVTSTTTTIVRLYYPGPPRERQERTPGPPRKQLQQHTPLTARRVVSRNLRRGPPTYVNDYDDNEDSDNGDDRNWPRSEINIPPAIPPPSEGNGGDGGDGGKNEDTFPPTNTNDDVGEYDDTADFGWETSKEHALPPCPPSQNELIPAIICDNGGGVIKSGFAGDHDPTVQTLHIVGRPKYDNIIEGFDIGDAFIGRHAQAKRGVLKLTHPIKNGIVQDWDDMEMVWEYLFEYEMGIDTSEHALLITEAPLNPKKNRERMAEILFESFDFPSLYMPVQASMALVHADRRTGVVVDCGDGQTSVTPIYEGSPMQYAEHRMNLGGRDVTEQLVTLARGRGHNLVTSAETDIARLMKEKLAYVSYDYDAEVANPNPKTVKKYVMPDDQVVTLHEERFQCAEILFRPGLLGHDLHEVGIASMVHAAVQKCAIDLRSELYSHILLAGGTTKLPGFAERLRRELRELTGGIAKIKIAQSEDACLSAWRGASQLGAYPRFSEMLITRADFDEFGDNIVHYRNY